MKKIPFNHKIALENPKAVVKTKNGKLVTDLIPNHIAADPYLLTGNINFKSPSRILRATWMLNGYFSEDMRFDDTNLELYVPFTSLWDRIKYYLKLS